jgi:HlyD family secretion protein
VRGVRGAARTTPLVWRSTLRASASYLVRRGGAALALAAVLTACSGGEAPLVEVEPVTSGEVAATVSAPARVDPAARQDVAASVSGVVVALNAADGAAVQGGQEIVRLESSQVAAAQEQASAAQAAAQGLGGIQVGGGDGAVRAAEQVVADLDARSRPNIDAAREQAAQIADPQQRAAAEAAVAALEASYLNTRAALLASAHALAEQQAAVSASLTEALNQAVLQATAGQRAQAEAAARLATEQAAGLSVVAPFAGVVSLGEAAATDGGAAAGLGALAGGDAGFDVGALSGALPGLAGGEGGGTLRVGAPVTAGQTLFTLYDLSARYVDADVDEVDAPSVRAGQRAVVLVDAFPEVTFTGTVESVAVEAATTEAGGVGYPTRVRITGVEGGDDAVLDRLLVGQTASAEIVTDTTQADLVVPSRAILDREAGTVVLVVRDGRVAEVPVRTVTLGEDAAAVEGDLAEGDEVVVAGYEDLYEDLVDGAAVRVAP